MVLQVNHDCAQQLNEIFDRFASEDEEFGFTRTHFPIKIAEYGPDGLVSRSKAKRVLNRFNKFKEVVLDFEGVESIGQGFADEIFRVYFKQHPEVHINWMNANEQVERMIKRALTSNIEENGLSNGSKSHQVFE